MVRLRRALKLLAIVLVVSCIFIHHKDALCFPVSVRERVDVGDGTVTSRTFPTSVNDQNKQVNQKFFEF